MLTRLQAGDGAPDFALEDQAGRMVRSSDYRGRKLLVYFYPKADTPGCTAQSCAVRDAVPELDAAGVDAVGISPDAVRAQQQFAEKYGLGFPLLADTEHEAAEAYGVWVERSRAGRTSMGILRSAFLVDGEGCLEAVWYDVRPEDTVPKVREALRSKETE